MSKKYNESEIVVINDQRKKVARKIKLKKSSGWIKVADNDVKHVWKRTCDCNGDRQEMVEVSPDWYETNGTPICQCGDDMAYSHTMIKNKQKKKVEANQIIEKMFNASVDAGNVGIADVSYLIDNGGKINNVESFLLILDVPAGEYEYELEVKDSWKGGVGCRGKIKTNGKLYIGDICYAFSNDHDAWIDFLNATEYLNKGNEFMQTVSTGGDGEFTCVVKLKKI